MEDFMDKTATELFESANRAAAEAIRWSREPNGEGLSALRRRDARNLRALARAALMSAAIAMPMAGHAQTVHFDPQAATRNMRLENLNRLVFDCLRSTINIDLHHGERDRLKLADHAAVRCVGLAVEMGIPKQEAVVDLDELAYQLVPDVAANGE